MSAHEDAVKARWPVRRLLRQAGEVLLDQLYPPICLGCDAMVARADGLCASCWRDLRPITDPKCPVLGTPFEVSLGPDVRSAAAIADPPPFDRSRSAFVYNDSARALVSALKYKDKPEIAIFCATAMRAAAPDLLQPGALLVPVPLHWSRHWRRRYNQSVELAGALSRLTGCDLGLGLVRRHRRTRPQVGLSLAQRARNVSGAFKVRDDAQAKIAGRHVVIVDDVITTGATVSALTRTLKRAGAERIDIISFARVVTGAQTPI